MAKDHAPRREIAQYLAEWGLKKAVDETPQYGINDLDKFIAYVMNKTGMIRHHPKNAIELYERVYALCYGLLLREEKQEKVMKNRRTDWKDVFRERRG